MKTTATSIRAAQAAVLPLLIATALPAQTTTTFFVTLRAHTNTGFYAFGNPMVAADGGAFVFRDDYAASRDRAWFANLDQPVGAANPRMILDVDASSSDVGFALQGIDAGGLRVLFTRRNNLPGTYAALGTNGIYVHDPQAGVSRRLAPTVTDPRIADPAEFQVNTYQRSALSGNGTWVFHFCSAPWGPVPYNWGSAENPLWAFRYTVSTNGRLRVWRMLASGGPAEQAAALEPLSSEDLLADPLDLQKYAIAADRSGNVVAFVAPARDTGQPAVFTIRDGIETRIPVTPKIHPAAGVAVSDDGTWVAFGVEYTTVNRRACIARTDGTSVTILSNAPPAYPEWGSTRLETVSSVKADGTSVLAAYYDASAGVQRLFWADRTQAVHRAVFSDPRFHCGPASASADGGRVGLVSWGTWGTGTCAVQAVEGYGFTVNDGGDLPDADVNDGVADVDLVAPGLQTTLRAAIQEANRWPGADRIHFNLPPGDPVVTPVGALPDIADRLVLDGTTQPGGGMVEVDGRMAASACDGLYVDVAGCHLAGLRIRGFLENGIVAREDISLRNVELATNSLWGLQASGMVDVTGRLAVIGNGTEADPSRQGGLVLDTGSLFAGSAGPIEVCGNGGDGIKLIRSGAALWLSEATVSGNAEHGIVLTGEAHLRGDCRVNSNRLSGIYNFGTGGVEAHRLEASYNGGWGVHTKGGFDLLEWGRICANGTDWTGDGGLYVSHGSVLAAVSETLTVDLNVGDGIRLVDPDGDVHLANASVSTNRDHGIRSAGGVVCVGTLRVNANRVRSGIVAGGEGVEVDDLEVCDNGEWGIWSQGSVLINESGRVNRNGTAWDDQGGIRVDAGFVQASDVSSFEAVGNLGDGIRLVNSGGDVDLIRSNVSSNLGYGVTSAGDIRFRRSEASHNLLCGVRSYGTLTVGGPCRIEGNGRGGSDAGRAGIRIVRGGLVATDPDALEVLGNHGDGIRGDREGETNRVALARVVSNRCVGINVAGHLRVDAGAIRDNRGGNLWVGGERSIAAGVDLGDTENDGVSDSVEAGAPNGGDGNRDGIADSLQANVASFEGVAGGFLTLAGASDRAIVGLGCGAAVMDAPAVPGVVLPLGTLRYQVQDAPQPAPDAARWNASAAGGLFVVEIILPDGVTADGYYKFGPTADVPSNHWYRFEFDGTTGATVVSNRVTIRFMDGGRGDDDGAANGVIADTGAPYVHEAVLGGPSREPGGRVGLALYALAGRWYDVEVSSNMVHWRAVGATHVVEMPTSVIDPDAPDWPARYYRVRRRDGPP